MCYKGPRTVRTFFCYRRKTPQMRRVLQSLQSILEPNHTHAQAHRVQTLLVWAVREGLPKKGRLEEAQRIPTSLGDGSHRQWCLQTRRSQARSGYEAGGYE